MRLTALSLCYGSMIWSIGVWAAMVIVLAGTVCFWPGNVRSYDSDWHGLSNPGQYSVAFHFRDWGRDLDM